VALVALGEGTDGGGVRCWRAGEIAAGVVDPVTGEASA
jgi:hypothetical protein